MAGLNIPWNSFGYDIGGNAFNATWFTQYFQKAQANQQNIARFWVHCDGARAGLEYDSGGKVSGLSPTFNADLIHLLSIAQEHSVVVQLCLWSFDMCKDEMQRGSTQSSLISNQALTHSYVDNALKPMLAATASYPNLLVEVINEPEWCIQGPGGAGVATKNMVPASDMQRFVSMIAEAAHHAGRKVTVGSASLKWSSHAQEAEASYWDDTALKKAYSSSNGTLDFYNVHYYDWMWNPTWGYDPMRASTTHWKLDKPTVIAEMVPKSDHYSIPDVLSKSTSNGFSGVLFWAYNDHNSPITDDVAPLKAYAAAHGASYEAIVTWLGAPTPPPTPPPCTDQAPDAQSTCAQQKSWGKCSASFMKGWCCRTCFQCDPKCGQ